MKKLWNRIMVKLRGPMVTCDVYVIRADGTTEHPVSQKGRRRKWQAAAAGAAKTGD